MIPVVPALIIGGVAIAAIASRKQTDIDRANGGTIDLGPMPEPIVAAQRHKLANLLKQPLDVAVEAARERYLKGSAVTDIYADDGHLVFETDPNSTAALLIPPEFLGWPTRLQSQR